MSDEEIAALKAQVEAEFVAGGGTIPPRPTDAELQAMSDEELDQREAQIRAEIAKEEEEEAVRDAAPPAPARGTKTKPAAVQGTPREGSEHPLGRETGRTASSCQPPSAIETAPEGVGSHVSYRVIESDACPTVNASSSRDGRNGAKEEERSSFWAKRAKIPHR
jgi:hypothetical protein